MSLLQNFQQYIERNHLFNKRDKLLLAVSGGIDSVVLCELCKQKGYDFAILHCNFQLRGAESERDEQFVRSLAGKYGVEIFVKRFETEKHAYENRIGIQEAARALRYWWFFNFWHENAERMAIEKETVKHSHISGWHTYEHGVFIATAHHADDNIETLLMNFFKGTGIRGLHGISPKEFTPLYLVRPLLFAKKEAIKIFGAENNLSFVEDSSNASNKYTRNYFRNELIPGIKKVFPEVENNLIHNIERFKEIEVLYQQSIAAHKKNLLEEKGQEIHIPVLKLQQTKPLNTVLYEIISDYSFTPQQVSEVAALLKSESGKYVENHLYRIIRNRKWLIISPSNSRHSKTILIEAEDNYIPFEGGGLELKIIDSNQSSIINNQLIAQLDAAEIKFPLLLRKWKQGDYFYPLGMQKKKKLSRFFIDQKLSLTDKEKVWVLESNKKILWVIGLRIDDRFKITTATKTVLQVTFKMTDA